MIFVLGWCWYGVRLAVYYALALLRFTGKPGSRVLIPGMAAAVAVLLLRPWLHDEITAQLRQLDPGFRPEGWLLDTLLGLALLLAFVAYGFLSRILAVVFGAFPLPMRPLPPMRRLKATTQTEISAAPVSLAVPPLPRRAADLRKAAAE